jgi:hypothetical protein
MVLQLEMVVVMVVVWVVGLWRTVASKMPDSQHTWQHHLRFMVLHHWYGEPLSPSYDAANRPLSGKRAG